MPVIQMLMGGVSASSRVQVFSGYIIGIGSTVLASRALVEFNTDGTQYRQEGSAAKASMGSWLKTGVVGDYQIRATLTSGTSPSGTVGSWLALSSTQTWSVSAPSGTQVVTELLFEIRDAATSAVLDSATVILDSTRM